MLSLPRLDRRPVRRWVLLPLVLAAIVARAPAAAAHSAGIVSDSCGSCHSGDGTADVTLAADRAMFNPGDSVTFTLTIKSSSIKVGGTYVTTGGVGTLQPISGEGLAANGQGLTHTAPKAAVGGAVTFRFGWKAPATAGGVAFLVAALAANGNGASSGDVPTSGLFQWVFGCAGQTFYADLDRDGYGSSSYGTLLGCANAPPPVGYATKDGDCDENDAMVNPGATEICNGKDDNCNGQIDENAPAVMLWPDGDGDGYYKFQTGTPKLGCGGIAGYAAVGGDCDDTDPTIHPGATEICNGKDDNCDGSVDERVRPQCGVGSCRRESPTCNAKDCVPGRPGVETCNLLDDDCDGEVDDNACPAGQTCDSTQCVAGGAMSGGGGGTVGTGGTGATGSGGAPSGTGGTMGTGGATSAASGGAAVSGAGGSGGTGAGKGAGAQQAGGGCAVAGVSPFTSSRSDDSVWVQAILALILTTVLRGRRRSGASGRSAPADLRSPV